MKLDGHRLVIAHNPHSSRARSVQSLVFKRLDDAGYDYTIIEVRQASLADNVDRLRHEIKSDDVIICASGDGSAHAVAHSILASDQPNVKVGFLAFGNFNDMARTFTDRAHQRDPVAMLQSFRHVELFPLSIFADGQFIRHAMLYATFGWTARAAARFDQPTVRQKITNGGAGLMKNIWRLGIFYMQSRRDHFLPEFKYQGVLQARTTDILCVNGPSLARVFRSTGRYHQTGKFLYKRLDVSRLLANVPFLVSAVCGHLPGEPISEFDCRFAQSIDLPLQCDGEVVELHDVSRITVSKSKLTLSVMATR